METFPFSLHTKANRPGRLLLPDGFPFLPPSADLGSPHCKQCFWCRQPTRYVPLKKGVTAPLDAASRDHLVPVALGGIRDKNLVNACHGCNKERGLVIGAKIELQRFYHRIQKNKQVVGKWPKPWRQQAVGLHSVLVRLRSKIQFWRGLEQERLGLSFLDGPPSLCPEVLLAIRQMEPSPALDADFVGKPGQAQAAD